MSALLQKNTAQKSLRRTPNWHSTCIEIMQIGDLIMGISIRTGPFVQIASALADANYGDFKLKDVQKRIKELGVENLVGEVVWHRL